jgi:hypothetical protein
MAATPIPASADERIGEVIRRALPMLPGNVGQQFRQMLTPASLAIVSGTLVLWAGSHLVGIGEFVDILLVGVGVLTLGLSALDGVAEFRDFVHGALTASSDGQLDEAAHHLARAVIILGISVVMGALLHGQARAVARRGLPKLEPRILVNDPPAAGVNRLQLSRPSILPGGNLGITDEYGAIEISRDQPIDEQRITLYHELVHRYFSPKVGPLLKLRAELGITGYSRSALLRYLEEALAEGYGQMKVHGLAEGLKAYRFPLEGKNAYVTISQLRAEGTAIGTITLGGQVFSVSISKRAFGAQ